MDKNILNKRIEETLNSTIGITHAEANPYIYDKILSGIGNKKNTERSPVKNLFVLKFAVILIAALLVNVFTYFTYPKYESEYSNADTNNREENLRSFAKEYSITGTTYNY